MTELSSLGDFSKKPYPLRNCIILNETAGGVHKPRGHSPAASWFMDHLGCLVGNYVISQWDWVFAFIPWPMRSKITGFWEIAQFITSPFYTDFDTDHGISRVRLIQMIRDLNGQLPADAQHFTTIGTMMKFWGQN